MKARVPATHHHFPAGYPMSSPGGTAILKIICAFCIILSLCSIFTLQAAASTAKKSRQLEIGDNILPRILELDFGHRLSSQNLGGKVILMVFAVAEQELSAQALQEAQKLSRDTAGNNLITIGVISSVKDPQAFQELVRTYRLTYQTVLDEGDVLSTLLGIIVYPTTIIINREGLLAYYYPLYASDYYAEVSSHLTKITEDKEGTYLAEEIKRRKQEQRLSEARTEIERGNVQEGIAILNELLAKGYVSHNLHLLLGYALLNMKQPAEALAQFYKAKEISPETKDADLGMGIAYARTGKKKQAVELLTEKIKSDPAAHIAYRELSRIYEDSGDVEKAVHYIKKELECLITQLED